MWVETLFQVLTRPVIFDLVVIWVEKLFRVLTRSKEHKLGNTEYYGTCNKKYDAATYVMA